jgi:hypothetical protein
MVSKGRVRLSEIFAMLKDCAPDAVPKEGQHKWRVFRQGRVAFLPTGEHGKRDLRAEIQFPYVKKLVSALGVDPECAGRYFPRLAAS